MNFISGNLRPAWFRVGLIVLSLFLAGWLVNLVSPLPATAALSSPLQVPGAGIGSGFNSPFGMNVQALSRYRNGGSGDDYSTPLNPAQQAGIAWNREEITWDKVEPRPGIFDWGDADRAVNASARRGINVLGLLGYNVNYSGGQAVRNVGMPDQAGWTEYVRQTVAHFKDRIHFWQIWNEPQDPTYFAPASPQSYLQVLQWSYSAIKSVDGSAQVLIAGFVPADNGIDWMNQFLALGGGSFFDIIAVHPYVNDPFPRGQPRGPNSSMSPERAQWATTDMNQVANFAYRVGKPVWATEFGWTTTDSIPGARFNHVSPDQQADYIVRAYVTGLSVSPIQKFMLYQFHEDNNDSNDRYGILNTQWQATKPAYGAYKTMASQLNGLTPLGPRSAYEGSPQHINLTDFDTLGGSPANCSGGQPGSGFWQCYASSPAQVQLSLSGEQHHSGGQALKINYGFQAGPNGRYIVAAPLDNDQAFGRLNSAGHLNKIGLWLYGDGNRTIVRLSVTDANGQESQYDMGRMGPPTVGWQRYEAQLAYPNTGSNQNPAFPLKKLGLILDGQFQPEAYNGTVFVDDIYAEDTPPVYLYRFARADGQNVDVVWADNTGATVSLPSQSGQATVISRDGQTQTVGASNGAINVTVGDAPTYIIYKAAQDSSGGGSGGSGGGGSSGGSGGFYGNGGNCSQTGDPNLRARFDPIWQHFDEAITSGRATRSWIWGPPDHAFRYIQEQYEQAPGGCRTILYWDKSRMEITNPGGNPGDKYYVTNGLLAKELISGQIQIGDSHLVPAPNGPAQIPAAGDTGGNPNTPTYAAFAGVTTLKPDEHYQPNREGAAVIETIGRNGNTATNSSLAGYNVHLTQYQATTHHNTADVFWKFMNSRGPVKVGGVFQDGDAVDWIYSIGLPISDPYWARVTVAGVEKDVLIQVFERRVLTYTPSNPAGFQVEMGNIGGHYATWRYGKAQP